MMGGNFGLKLRLFFCLPKPLPFSNDSTYWLQSGRSAFSFVANLLKLKPGDEILIPAYHCEEMTNPFFSKGIKCRYYTVSENLQVELKEIKKKVSKKTKALLYVPFLGFTQKEAKKIQIWCQQKKIIVIEDNVPVIPNRFKSKINVFQVFSFRKYCNVPDGAALILPKGKKKTDFAKINLISNKNIAVALQCLSECLKSLAGLTQIRIISEVSYKFYRAGEDLLDDQPRRISAVSKFLIKKFNWVKIAEKRRVNAKYIVEQLKSVSEVKPAILEVDNQSTPLFLPIITNKQEGLKKYLVHRGIFVNSYWQFPTYLDKDNFRVSFWLTKHIICLIVDQRYGEKQMKRQISQVKKFFNTYD